MNMVQVTNVTDHAREVRVGIRHEGPWVTAGPGETIKVRHEVAYGWPADDEHGLPAMGGLLDQEDNWALAKSDKPPAGKRARAPKIEDGG